MQLRIYTEQTYIDLKIKSTITFEELCRQLEEGNTLLLETEQGTKVILNTINILMIEEVFITNSEIVNITHAPL